VADRSFDLDLHLRRMELPVGGTFRDVLDIAEVMATTGFDPELPLWESVVVEGVDGARAAFLIKMHHALVDGVGGIAVLLHLLDTVRRPSRKPVAPYHATPAPPPLSLLERLPDPRHVIDMAVRTATHPVDEMEHVVATAESVARLLAPAGAPLSPLMTGRSFRRAIEVVDLPPGALRQVATATSGTLNDVFVAAIMGGLRRYHELHGADIDSLRALMPVNVRVPGQADAGNHFVPARFVVPVSDDPAECVREVQKITNIWKHAPGLALSDVLADGLSLLPAPAVSALWGSMLKGDDFCITNVPGPPFETFLGGARIERMYAFAPPSGAALNVSLVTPAGRSCVGIIVDKAAVPDSPKLAGCLAEGFEELFRLAQSPRELQP
jgi:diacylglycerol O-acyltransferase